MLHILQIHCDLQEKNVRTLWPNTYVIGQPLPKNGQKMANGRLLFRTLQVQDDGVIHPIVPRVCFPLPDKHERNYSILAVGDSGSRVGYPLFQAILIGTSLHCVHGSCRLLVNSQLCSPLRLGSDHPRDGSHHKAQSWPGELKRGCSFPQSC